MAVDSGVIARSVFVVGIYAGIALIVLGVIAQAVLIEWRRLVNAVYNVAHELSLLNQKAEAICDALRTRG
jgi:hypothetical protein